MVYMKSQTRWNILKLLLFSASLLFQLVEYVCIPFGQDTGILVEFTFCLRDLFRK